MTPIPAQLTRTFADIDQNAIAAWWSTLSDAHRDEIARLCDARADTCFFGVVADESELPEVERDALELWVPAEELPEFNRQIEGKIQVIHEFH
jgi:hypothetical protein